MTEAVVWHYFLPCSLNKKAIRCFSRWDFSLYTLKCQTFVVIELHLLSEFCYQALFPYSIISHRIQQCWLQSIQELDCSTVCCWALLPPHFLKSSTGWVSPDLIISIQEVFVCDRCKSHDVVPPASCSPDSFEGCNEAQDDWNVEVIHVYDRELHIHVLADMAVVLASFWEYLLVTYDTFYLLSAMI